MKDLISKEIVKKYCDRFNKQDEELYRNDIPNAQASEFLCEQIPRFECPDKTFEEIWYFRWWSFRKHIRSTPFGRVLIEFMPNVSWAGAFNTINCPAAHQLREARWFNDKQIAHEYLNFWMNPDSGAAVRCYTFCPAHAALDVAAVSGDLDSVVQQYPQFRQNYREWQKSHQAPNGLFFQLDGYDGMECSVGGSGYRVTINSCMAAEAAALAVLAEKAGFPDEAAAFQQEYSNLYRAVTQQLWNEKYSFFMTRSKEDESFVNIRELHGFTPWYYFLLPKQYDRAWKELGDPDGFQAPFGPTTAERRHPGFRIDRTGHECQWNGPSWPFATSVTLTALEKLLHERASTKVPRRLFFEVLSCYTRSHYLRENGKIVPWIDENLDPFTGIWLARELLKSNSRYKERGKDYSHSTYADLIITGLCGIDPDIPGKITADPLIPEECWPYFLLDGLRLKNHTVSLQYDKSGEVYGRGKGLLLFIDGTEAARSETFGKIEAQI